MAKEVKNYKLKALPSKPIPDAILYIKADGDSSISTYITDVNGIPYPLKDDAPSGGVQSIFNTDGTISVIGPTDVKVSIQSSILNTINSALQPGDLPNTKAEFNSQLSDGDFLFVGDVIPYTDEEAQDAVGNIFIDTNTIDITYDDLTPSISAIVKPNSITPTELADNINLTEFVNNAGFENTSQLNTRDTNNRNRANHNGTQAISTIVNLQNSLDNKLDEGGYVGTAQTLADAIDAIFVPDQLISGVPPTRSVNTFTYPALGYTALISKTLRTNPSSFVTTISAASTTNHKRVDLIYFKPDNTLAKLVGTEDLIIAPRPDVPAGSVGVSFINVFGNVIDTPTPITDEISVQNSLGVEQFKITDYFRVRGASFSSSLKQISIDPTVPFTAFVDRVNGNDSIAELGNSNKPYKTIDAVFIGLTDSVDRQIIIQLITKGNYPINNRLPVGQTTIRSTLEVTIDLSANTNQYLFLTYNNGSLSGSTLNFDLPNGTLQNLRSGGTGTNIAQGQTSYVLNLKSIVWDCTSYMFYGNDAVIQKLDSLNTKGVFSNVLLVKNGFKTNTLTIPVGAVETVLSGIGGTVEISSLVLNVGSIQFSGDVYYRIGNISGTGVLNFTYQGGSTVIDFINSVVIPKIRISQTIENLTFTGSIKSCPFDETGYIGGGVLNFKNFIIDNVTSGYFLNSGAFTFNIINTTIKLPSFLIYKVGGASATINIVNSTIEQIIPTYLIGSEVNAIVNLKVGGLETNATSLGSSKDIIVDYALLSFKDKKNEIVVRNKVDIINKTLDSNMTYLIDGVLTLLTGEYIEIPIGGLTINGYGFTPSSIKKNVSGQSIFTSPISGSGDLVSINISYYPGLGSVFNIKDATGNHAIELDKVNFQGVTGSSLGIWDNYRQFTGTTCGLYSLSDGITLEGTWSGFKLTNSNIIGFGSTGTLFKKGTSTLFSNRFYIDLNIQISTGSKICDFADANFTNDKSLQVVNCYAKVNGAVNDSTTATNFPNITPYSTKAYFVNNIGIKNSNNMPYGISTGNMQTYADDSAASAGGIVAVGDTYIETSTGYFKKRLT